MKIRDRIKELRRVKASDLVRNPRNWHTHPEAQRDALRGVLAEIGFAGAGLARELDDGRLELIDGELRADETGDGKMPVLVLDVTADEADTILATFDPIGALAEASSPELQELLEGRTAEDANVRELLDSLLQDLPTVPESEESSTGSARIEGMNLRPHEHYDYLIILARTVQEWNQLVELIGLEKTALEAKGKIGYGRGIAAAKLIELLRPSPTKATKPRRKKARPKE